MVFRTLDDEINFYKKLIEKEKETFDEMLRKWVIEGIYHEKSWKEIQKELIQFMRELSCILDSTFTINHDKKSISCSEVEMLYLYNMYFDTFSRTKIVDLKDIFGYGYQFHRIRFELCKRFDKLDMKSMFEGNRKKMNKTLRWWETKYALFNECLKLVQKKNLRTFLKEASPVHEILAKSFDLIKEFSMVSLRRTSPEDSSETEPLSSDDSEGSDSEESWETVKVPILGQK